VVGSPNPHAFVADPTGTVWHVDFTLRAADWQADLGEHGLFANDPPTDQACNDRVLGIVLSELSQKYLRKADGTAISGTSYRITFVTDAPSALGAPGVAYDREAQGGLDASFPLYMGFSLYNPGNQLKVDNSGQRPDATGALHFWGVFTRNVYLTGSTWQLVPPLSASDLKFVNGSYTLGSGTAADDQRFLQVQATTTDYATAISFVNAHEIGHSVGLSHDTSDPKGIMLPFATDQLCADPTAHFDVNSLSVLTTNLGKSP
jgi:hypothetical protein